MPRKKKTIVEETLPDDAPQVGEDFADAICVTSKVYKLNAGGKSFCFQTTEPVDEIYIQAQYPTGGKFIVNELNSLNQVINTTHIDIEPKPLLNGSNNGNSEDIRVRMLMEELSFTRNMMLQMMQGVFTNKTGTPIGELAQAMEAIHNISGKSNPVDLIIKGMELGQKSNGGSSDWKTELLSTAKEYAPAVVTALQARQPQTQGQPMIATTPQSMMVQGLNWLKPQILSGMTIDLAIGWVIQNAKDPLCNQLIAEALKGDINTFIAIDPEIANEPYRGWFEGAIQMLKEEYAAQSGTVSDNERGNRDDSDVADDAPVSTRKSKVSKAS